LPVRPVSGPCESEKQAPTTPVFRASAGALLWRTVQGLRSRAVKPLHSPDSLAFGAR
jgi:hypothetical protein